MACRRACKSHPVDTHAAQTTGIRLGSGAVLMNHYSPFKVAAMFKQLEAMYTRRIDLGMGRATSGRPSTWPCAAIANHNRWTTMPRKSWKSVMTKDHLIGLGPASR